MFSLDPRRGFRLSGDRGIKCDARGAYVGSVPLLARCRCSANVETWKPRSLEELNKDLSNLYGIPIDFARKIFGVTSISTALNENNIALAQIITLHLRLPEPPTTKSDLEFLLVMQAAHVSGMLKRGWDPTKHPRWPSGSAEGRGGRFAPSGTAEQQSHAGNEAATPVVPAQIAIPWDVPWEMPWDIPTFPREFGPTPLDIPTDQQRTRKPPVNPFPRKRKCVEEWEYAEKFCADQERKKNLHPGYHGYGKDYYSCVMGQVSAECGGNRTDA